MVQVQSWNISGCTLGFIHWRHNQVLCGCHNGPGKGNSTWNRTAASSQSHTIPNYPRFISQALTSCLVDDKETCKNTDVGAFCFLCHLLSQLCEILFGALAFMPESMHIQSIQFNPIFLQSLRTQGGTCREMPAPALRWMNSQVQTLHTILTFPFKLHSSQVCQKPNGQRLTTSGLLIHVKVVHPYA